MRNCFILLGLVLFTSAGSGQVTDIGLSQLIEGYKQDLRGPYQDIRWFCPDGTTNLPKDYCSVEEGIQHARYKGSVESLWGSNHLYLGQILAATDFGDFWDEEHNQSRLKQYLIGRFLQRIDDGWILRKAQYYRGAIQQEDEEEWAMNFFRTILQNNEILEHDFFLIRQSLEEIPHKGANNLKEQIWAESKVISDTFPAFQNLRVKMHGQPEVSDLAKVVAFRDEYRSKLSSELIDNFKSLIDKMSIFYSEVELKNLRRYTSQVPSKSKIRLMIEQFMDDYGEEEVSIGKVISMAELIQSIRIQLPQVKSSTSRIALLDISVILENRFRKDIDSWEVEDLEDLLHKICYSGMVAHGTGFIESWEWDEVMMAYSIDADEDFTMRQLVDYLDASRRIVEWGTAMSYGVYGEVVNQYVSFESLSSGFYDERIRNSILLQLGRLVSRLGDVVASEGQFSNDILGFSDQNVVRGVNPGYAKGQLVVVSNDYKRAIEDDKIYVFEGAPSDITPIAGVMTVSEGNMVSHVQLLSRNFGIPNAVISNEIFNALKVYNGKEVFYAVSDQGTTIVKLASEMTPEESDLFMQRERSNEKVRVPIEAIDLVTTRVINLRSLDASSSGVVCGPKAANLAELKTIFPDKVVEGIVIPFGVFRNHLAQRMPGAEVSYWVFLQSIFEQADEVRNNGGSEKEIEQYILRELSVLRDALKEIELSKTFYDDLKLSFADAFGDAIGQVPVFVRSDTNMEDLEEFTGAGLNRTLFNVVELEDIIRGIREVWASPFTERSYKWRQRYLINPENVFPSILIIPSVDVQSSGVLITKGIVNDDVRDLTVAFSRGAGGAVDGQAAESWLLSHTGKDMLIAPARESKHRRLPVTGGTSSHYSAFNQHILSRKNKYDIRNLAYAVYQKFDKNKSKSKGPYDIELGFRDDNIWLFQIRPFVENSRARSSEYLKSISPKVDYKRLINRRAIVHDKENL